MLRTFVDNSHYLSLSTLSLCISLSLSLSWTVVSPFSLLLTLSSAQSAGAVEYTDCISAENKTPTHPTIVLDMTLSNLMVRLLWGMRITPSMPSLPGPLWPRVVAPERVLSMGQIELFDIQTKCKQMKC